MGKNVVNEVFYSSKHQLRYLNDGLRANYTRDPEISLHKTIENVTGVVAGSLSWFGSLRLRQIRSNSRECSSAYPEKVRRDRADLCFYDYQR